MKKKILFVIPEYSIGGTNTSLENLISNIDKDLYQIYVYSVYEYGSPHFIETFKPYRIRKSILFYLLHDNIYTRKIYGLYMKICKKANWDWLYKWEAKHIQKKNTFDSVIGFQEGYATELASYFKDTKKIAWNHSPYSNNYKKDYSYYFPLYSKFDHIVCVSWVFVRNFIEIFPEYKDRTICLYNTLNNLQIRKKAKDNDVTEISKEKFNIISVGRFSSQKGFHLIPQIVDKIIKKGVDNFIWYIVGTGADYYVKTKELVKQYGLEKYIRFLGAKENPYPYISTADLYVCTSESESFCYTLVESEILHTPVLTNAFPVTEEVLDERCGWKCSMDDMSDMIVKIINDENGIYSLKKNSILSYEYDNDSIITEFCKLV